MHRDGLRGLLGAAPFLGRADGVEVGQRVGATAMEGQAHLVHRVGVADARRHGEAVELAFDQREGAALRVRVLRGDDQVRLGQRPRLAVDADLALLHRLEQRRLRARWRAVELVHQHDVSEDRTGPEIPRPGIGHEDRHAGDVRREQVGVALDPRQLGTEGDGQRPGQHRLADARHVLDEEVTARERGHCRRHQRAAAAEDDLFEIVHQCLAQRDRAVQIAHTLVDDAHRVTAVPWAMVAKTTGVRTSSGPRPRPLASSRGCVRRDHTGWRRQLSMC